MLHIDDDRVECSECGESVPRMHTAQRAGIGRLCWFCYSDDEDTDDDEYELDYDGSFDSYDDTDWEY